MILVYSHFYSLNNISIHCTQCVGLLTSVLTVLLEELLVALPVEGGAAGMDPQHAEGSLLLVHPLQEVGGAGVLQMLQEKAPHTGLLRESRHLPVSLEKRLLITLR